MSERIFKKGLVFGVLLLFVGTIVIPTTMSESESRQMPLVCVMQNTWTVDDDLEDYPDADFTDIQEAIDNASVLDGDTIKVYKGNYSKIVVYKQLTLDGGHNGTSNIEGPGEGKKGSTVSITASGVIIRNFTIFNSGDHQNNTEPWDRDAGVHITAKNAVITKNKIVNNRGNGIFSSGDNTEITYNLIFGNVLDGIGIYGLNPGKLIFNVGTKISNNKIADNGKDGIYLWRNKLPIINNNYITGNGKGGESGMAGIKIHRTRAVFTGWSASIKLNWITNNTGCGVIIERGCFRTELRFNNISRNSDLGVRISRSMLCDVYRNDFINNAAKNAISLRCYLPNFWNENYWDDYWGVGPYYIPSGSWFTPFCRENDPNPSLEPWNYTYPVDP
jgi:parallel beta-helix repeat protein